MKITYHGPGAVDIDGHTDVQTGDTVDVPDDLARRLLFAGSAVADDGTVTPPAEPVWTAAQSPDPSARRGRPTVDMPATPELEGE